MMRDILPWATLLIQSKYLLFSSSNMYCFSARTILSGLDLKNSEHDGLHPNNTQNSFTLTVVTKCVNANLHCHTVM